jgi:cytochrome c5
MTTGGCWQSNRQSAGDFCRILHHDQEQSSIFSGGTLTVIFVAIVAVVFYNFARNLAHFTETVHHPDVEVHDTVAERIRPFGRVKLPGDELAPGEIQIDEVPQAEPHATELSGPQVFNEACIVCHGNGIGGAPMLNDRAIWVSRLAQGMETLYLHAIWITCSARYRTDGRSKMTGKLA